MSRQISTPLIHQKFAIISHYLESRSITLSPIQNPWHALHIRYLHENLDIEPRYNALDYINDLQNELGLTMTLAEFTHNEKDIPADEGNTLCFLLRIILRTITEKSYAHTTTLITLFEKITGSYDVTELGDALSQPVQSGEIQGTTAVYYCMRVMHLLAIEKKWDEFKILLTFSKRIFDNDNKKQLLGALLSYNEDQYDFEKNAFYYFKCVLDQIVNVTRWLDAETISELMYRFIKNLPERVLEILFFEGNSPGLDSGISIFSFIKLKPDALINKQKTHENIEAIFKILSERCKPNWMANHSFKKITVGKNKGLNIFHLHTIELRESILSCDKYPERTENALGILKKIIAYADSDALKKGVLEPTEHGWNNTNGIRLLALTLNRVLFIFTTRQFSIEMFANTIIEILLSLMKRLDNLNVKDLFFYNEGIGYESFASLVYSLRMASTKKACALADKIILLITQWIKQHDSQMVINNFLSKDTDISRESPILIGYLVLILNISNLNKEAPHTLRKVIHLLIEVFKTYAVLIEKKQFLNENIEFILLWSTLLDIKEISVAHTVIAELTDNHIYLPSNILKMLHKKLWGDDTNATSVAILRQLESHTLILENSIQSTPEPVQLSYLQPFNADIIGSLFLILLAQLPHKKQIALDAALLASEFLLKPSELLLLQHTLHQWVDDKTAFNPQAIFSVWKILCSIQLSDFFDRNFQWTRPAVKSKLSTLLHSNDAGFIFYSLATQYRKLRLGCKKKHPLTGVIASCLRLFPRVQMDQHATPTLSPTVDTRSLAIV